MAFLFEPPKFNEDNFNLWKCRMSIFLEATDYNIPDILKNGPHVPVKHETQWSEEDKKLVQLDVKIRHLISVSLPDNVFQTVMNCSTAKDMWDRLCLIYEGGEYVKEIKRDNLIKQYHSFFAKKGETLTDMFNRFYCLLSDLRVVGYENDDLTVVYEFADALPDRWYDLITCLKMNGSLDKMSLPGLYDKLRSYEVKAENKNAKKIASPQATKQVTRIGEHKKLNKQINQGRGEDRVSKTYDWSNDSETPSSSHEEHEVFDVLLWKYELNNCLAL